ncbi:hypothetical protein BDK51DRAFT_50689 [Blyttiomyces helicus]|uniref:Uncharacterized protein n=1 Tax=Blyttiomyces helicus TaxID=388810 RepID=A0A4P9VT75_9FUNG|nr:hypothetical protein BDK51DRAFT_50689 [Blyttiomyces helicus]|eukprot:RKO82699.1 hypothetical protein BDK51DRAFT_50689 [Blyttiomyces helicus]
MRKTDLSTDSEPQRSATATFATPPTANPLARDSASVRQLIAAAISSLPPALQKASQSVASSASDADSPAVAATADSPAVLADSVPEPSAPSVQLPLSFVAKILRFGLEKLSLVPSDQRTFEMEEAIAAQVSLERRGRAWFYSGSSRLLFFARSCAYRSQELAVDVLLSSIEPASASPPQDAPATLATSFPVPAASDCTSLLVESAADSPPPPPTPDMGCEDELPSVATDDAKADIVEESLAHTDTEVVMQESAEVGDLALKR